MTPTYYLVGEPSAGEFTLAEFLSDNPDLDPVDECAIRALDEGESVTLGGGASGVYTIARMVQPPQTAEERADARELYELSKLRPEQQEDYDRGDDR